MTELVSVWRGELKENIHRGDIAVVDKHGKLLCYVGDPLHKITYFRSCAKPIQVLPLITSGAADYFGFNQKELAVMAASHGGEEFHVEAVRSVLKKAGIEEAKLECGIHPPLDKAARKRLLASGQEPGAVHNNCSGKHAGMLALAKYKGFEQKGYLLPTHPLQQLMLEYIARVTDVPRDDIYIGIDGCGVPVFGLPLFNMAYAYARLTGPDSLPAKLQQPALIISKAMTENPHLVSGIGTFTTELMQATGGRVLAKSGADGVYCAGLMGEGIGIAVKIESGYSRASAPVVTEALKQLGWISTSELHKLSRFRTPEIHNHRSDLVGRMTPEFTLVFAV